MKNSIKFKFTLGLSIIFLISVIVLNILIRQVFQGNLENTIKNSMKNMINNSREYVQYKLLSTNLPFNEEGLDILSFDILDYFTSAYDCDSEIRDGSGKIIQSNISSAHKRVTEKVVKAALEDKVIITLQYNDEKAYASLAYPLYYEEKTTGILVIRKNFSELYSTNKRLVSLITYAEIGILIILFFVSFLFTSKLIGPITILTKGIKKVGEGDYGINLNIKSSDEIGVLSKEFMNMQRKIKEQIDTITKEKEKVLKLEKVRTQFFNNVTHELKTPLTGISCYSQVLLEEFNCEDDFKKRAVERIFMESERLHNLVLDLINISKGMSVIDEEKHKIDMKKLLEEICNDMEMKACKHSLTLYRHIEAGYITGQINKIRQVLINIIDNAIKYSYIEEDIRIKAFNDNGFFIVEICNKGDIIPNQVYENIFEPFVRCQKSKESCSTGLGLYISNEIIKKHNGEIYIENGEIIKVIIKIPSFRNTLETTEIKMDKTSC
jgi:signal transduction histidine kinase